LVIVEVKARRSVRAGLETVGARQQMRIAQAASALASRWRLTGAPIRFDVMVMSGLWVLRQERGAWSEAH
jgi:Holliday junction resolvase-like predicted endonuclease